MGDYSVATPAYVKLLLHAAKRPASSVCGLLVGQEQGQGFSISDVVPLFHHEAPLAPLLEVGCSMADVWSQQSSKKIVGFYYAGSGSTPSEGGSGLSHFAEKVADKVEANCSRSCVLVVDSQQLNNESKTGLQLLLKDVKRGWTRVENRLQVANGATKVLSAGLQQGVERNIADFEEHLEDTTKDWRNPHVVSLLKLNV
ncbi:ER membrane protein complex subunit 9 [Phytophthora boehmeriae]|uniref:ER membrane protein complex subunit 9 n=1 Tax=Phytophthora boehmeriae TaxID=109152 RepID=A0A8T1WPU2_9STRA|nr:ER membrane protein complex subunit 9 [Phytophthora boehmeriae]